MAKRSSRAAAATRGEQQRLTDVQLNGDDAPDQGRRLVELKVTVPPTAQRATIEGLPLDPVESQPRQVFFFDTPDLALDRAGLVVRARRIQAAGAIP